MEWLNDFCFLRPWWLLALVLPLIMSIGAWKSEQLQSSWAKVCDEHLLKFLLIKGQNRQRRRFYVLALVIMISAVVALAGPSWQKKENPTLKVNNPLIIALNVSSNMWNTDVTPSRGERAKFIVHDLLDMLQTSEIGLLVYSSEPFVVTPLTEDEAMIDNLLPTIAPDIMPSDGDRLDRAIDLALERMQQVGFTGGNIVVLTSDVGERFDSALTAAENAADKGFKVNVIQLSDAKNDKLQLISDKGHGLLLGYKDNLQKLANIINTDYQNEIKQSENMHTTWEDGGYFLFWLPAMLILYYFRRGVLLMLLFVLWANTATAGWFLNDNQEAKRLFDKGQYEKAAQKFNDVGWRGAAAYKSGDYQKALQDFASGEGLDALYNQGNALAKAGKIDAAIKKYEEVLAQDADFADAKYNLEYLKQQQQNQQQNQDKEQNQKEDEDSKAQQQQNQQQDQNGNEQKQGHNEQQEQPQNPQDNQDNNDDKQNNDKSSEQDSNQDNEQNSDNNSQAEDENKSAEQNSDDEQNKQENQPNQSSEDANNNDAQNNQSEQPQDANLSDEQGEQETQSAATQGGDEMSDQEKEKLRARQQRFREIPEDKGGLLRAFIRREYERQRYKD